MSVFESFHDFPVDEYAGDDHDDQQVPAGEVRHDPPRELAAFAAVVQPVPNQVVPFVYVKAGDRGPQVKALKRALSRAGYGTWLGSKFTGLMGPFAIRSLNQFKKKHGLPANGVYDKATWQKLAPWFDAWSIRYLLNVQTPNPTRHQLMRNAFLAQLMYLYNRRTLVRYTQARPWDLSKPPYGLDCSSSGEWAAKWTGLMKSLSGYTGWGFGNTDSEIARFRRLGAVRLSLVAAELCDPCYYGSNGDPSHVAFWLGRGSDGISRVWSNGSYPIGIRDVRYRHDLISACDLTAGQ